LADREVTLSALTAAFLAIGYVVGGDESLEPGFEEVALFADAARTPTHAARQLPSGAWTSKLGNAEDIAHELRALEAQLDMTISQNRRSELRPLLPSPLFPSNSI
jgi:hypothetical protein